MLNGSESFSWRCRLKGFLEENEEENDAHELLLLLPSSSDLFLFLASGFEICAAVLKLDDISMKEI